jgi:hypothetical protein
MLASRHQDRIVHLIRLVLHNLSADSLLLLHNLMDDLALLTNLSVYLMMLVIVCPTFGW